MQDHTTNETTVKLCECGCGQPAPIAQRSNARLRHVKGQPNRFIPGHHVRLRKYPPMEDRFWAKVNKDGPICELLGSNCWEWSAALDRKGYGVIGIKGSHIARAHRIAWELANGSIPDGMEVCHRCDNPACVRVSHLFLGDHTDNMRDMTAKGRHNGDGKPHGIEHHNAKLDDERVAEIRSRTATGESKIAIAAEYGVSVSLIYAIHHRKIWQHVNP